MFEGADRFKGIWDDTGRRSRDCSGMSKSDKEEKRSNG